MRVLQIGENASVAGLLEALGALGVAVERWPEGDREAGGAAEVAALARQLRELESALANGGPDAVLVASDSTASLAAVLVATKVGKPVAALAGPLADAAGANATLIRQLADATLPPEPPAISEWLSAIYTHRP